MQKECEILSDLKFEFGKFVDKSTKDSEVKMSFPRMITENKNEHCYRMLIYYYFELIYYNK